MTPIDFTFNENVVLTIDDILDDELLNVPEKPKKITSSDRLERAFLEIVEFRRSEGRAPSSQTREIAERKLGARLDGFLTNEAKAEAVKHLDEFGLLEAPAAPASLDELLESDDLDDLLGDDAGILDVSGLPAIKRPEPAESVAQRVKAKDFEQFEPLFKAKHAGLTDGTFTLKPFTGMDLIREGVFFVLNGVMCFVAEVGEKVDLVIGGESRKKQRLRLVFENGTESAMYDKSLQTRMYETQGQVLARTGHDASDILDADVESGHIYVLQSLSTDPLIANIKDLHKIGFSTMSVEQRVKSAATSPTYLMAPVKIVADYRVYNLKASALENLLHRVFADVRLDLTQTDRKGRDYDPSEWFVVPRDVINQAVAMIMSGEIVDYSYDKVQQKLVRLAE
ncbi:GIY-YIG nuclease family protein [Microbacterium aurugineum]|uniref:GIY-YIG nuclease family protein n=1 Tax=Microbacterium aurugineum TaxID=2851642 RepID=UPI0020BE3194|nr:GIY-YIG nuclease family protein [Microbacterium aurugineum]MCK8476037.1 GIY-YIG nuclease family protein [Microbacterium aurugineum]